MRKSILMLTAVAASLLALPALAQTPPAGGMTAAAPGGGRGAGMTQEQRAMQFVLQKGMTADQVTAERAKQRALSPEDRTKYLADLDAKWAKLTAAEKADAIANMPAGRGGPGGGAPGAAAP